MDGKTKIYFEPAYKLHQEVCHRSNPCEKLIVIGFYICGLMEAGEEAVVTYYTIGCSGPTGESYCVPELLEEFDPAMAGKKGVS